MLSVEGINMYCTFNFCSLKYHMVCTVSLKYSGERKAMQQIASGAFPANLTRLINPLKYSMEGSLRQERALLEGGGPLACTGLRRGTKAAGKVGWAAALMVPLMSKLSHSDPHSLRPA